MITFVFFLPKNLRVKNCFFFVENNLKSNLNNNNNNTLLNNCNNPNGTNPNKFKTVKKKKKKGNKKFIKKKKKMNRSNGDHTKNYSFDLNFALFSSNATNVQTKLDMDFRDRIWNGKVAVLFSLAEHEVVSKKSPAPVLSLLPRMSYLPLVTDHIRNHFIPHAPALQDGMWFECETTHHVLKWHVPIGVLYDICVPLHYSTPWHIIVHFQSYPDRPDVGRCDHIDVVKRTYFNALKQALLLGYNSVNMLVNLKKEDQDQLWSSVVQARYDLYFSIQNLMFDPTKEDQSSKKLLKYPFRIILQGFDRDSLDGVPIQRPVEVPSEKDGRYKTLEQVLKPILPGILEIVESEKTVALAEKSVFIKIQGLNVPLGSQMSWLVKHMCHPDYFLYVVIVKISKK
ncbi:hypothetical protein RFI_18246 [Reticulomyxa filosa]|uniref:Autophagy protein 5 n=1 Tax=Reticulomyxa filosa TaxID=46433 RepID=X6MZC3_RETFI|nr:hypothetical protein RFI_18246 [Reticulomyxa filosa]|eukprot:ETO18993.1 hypothetical protein RFI_18246 [Reticulomyxa filosa]